MEGQDNVALPIMQASMGCKMNVTEMVLKFLAGGSVVLAVTLLAKTKYPMLSGVIMLFPAATLVGYYFVGQTVDATQMQAITKFSMYGLTATLVFLIAFYYAQKTLSVPNSLIAALVSWIVSAAALIGVTQ